MQPDCKLKESLMNSNSNASEPRILAYGPKRLVGLSRICKSSADCHDVWADENGFQKRAGETQPPYYALCRCVVGAEPGAFEYMAASEVADDAPVPDGMSESVVPAG